MQISQTGTYKEKGQGVKESSGKTRTHAYRRQARILEPSNHQNSLNGFTFIELMVVIAIISVVMAIIMPSFWDIGRNSIKTEARHISSTLRYIYDEAVGKKQTYFVSFNLDDESWSFKGKDESKNFKIKRNVEIRDVVVPSHGEVSRGELIIEFGPMGPEEPIIVHLKKDELEYTIIFNQLNGRTKIVEGYKF